MESIGKLNRETIKYLAMATMFVNHFTAAFLPPYSLLGIFLSDIGYFTAPVMCYFLVEGYRYTRSKRNYAGRLLLFAIISQIPFCLVSTKLMTGEPGLRFFGMNMMFTLLLCFGILVAREKIRNSFLRIAVIVLLFVVSQYSDWSLFAPLYVLLFDRAGEDKGRIARAFLIVTLLFGVYDFVGWFGFLPLWQVALHALGVMAGPAAAAIVLLFFYNGQPSKAGKKASKWFFYWFYPVHLLILGLLSFVIP